MMRTGVITAASAFVMAPLVAACGFEVEPEAVLDLEDPGQSDVPDPDGPPDEPDPIARRCDLSDPALRLCLDFEDAQTLGFDASEYAHRATVAVDLTAMARDGEQAATWTRSSRLWFPEHRALDIEDELTVSMWFKPGELGREMWLLDNNRQYFLAYAASGHVRCGIDDVILTSLIPIVSGWHHVACTYDGDAVKLLIDGTITACESTSGEIPTDGRDGTAIGSNVGVNAGVPTFGQPFAGGLDNVQVFARAWSDDELCAAAGEDDCLHYCPGG